MDLQVVELDNGIALEGQPGSPLLRAAGDYTDVIGACFENGARAVLLYAANLPARFFDLRSGDAGVILQKFRQYRIRLAVVAAPDAPPLSRRFQELLIDEHRGTDFALLPDRAAAVAWLQRG
jgi:PadR family transcriptional regulator, regulatory protein AphA